MRWLRLGNKPLSSYFASQWQGGIIFLKELKISLFRKIAKVDHLHLFATLPLLISPSSH